MGIIAQIQREAARQQRAQRQAQTAYYRHQQAMHRAAEQALKAAERGARADERERKRLYVEARTAEVAADNADVQARLDELDALLTSTLEHDDHIDIGSLRRVVTHPPFDPGSLATPLPPPDWQRFAPPQPSGMAKVFGRSKYEQAVAAARASFAQAQAQHTGAEADRQAKLTAAYAKYQQWCLDMEAWAAKRNAKVDAFAVTFAAKEPDAIVEYFGMVLGNSVYPDDFPQHYRLAYVPESRQLVVEYELPTLDVVPAIRDYRYIKVRDKITSMPDAPADPVPARGLARNEQTAAPPPDVRPDGASRCFGSAGEQDCPGGWIVRAQQVLRLHGETCLVEPVGYPRRWAVVHVRVPGLVVVLI
ncbi:MAG TPA: hypothetical protein VFB74_14760 [Kribbellaceae bacterium]|nr:hypothetical protein [Kribbellaceae bacterium]